MELCVNVFNTSDNLFIVCIRLCLFSVIDYFRVKCNSTIQLNISSAATIIQPLLVSSSAAFKSSDPFAQRINQSLHPAPTASHGSISSSIGTSACPLKFRTHPGQRIEITLFIFGHYQDFDSSIPSATNLDTTSGGQQQRSSQCPVGVSFQELDGRRQTTPICHLRQRQQHLYTSNGTSVLLFFNIPPDKDKDKVSNGQKGSYYALKLEGLWQLDCFIFLSFLISGKYCQR